ncbi:MULTISPECIES: hypothetical protein [Halococcus]|uniref:Uncharacterized protein n=1 Tax=Halococcus salifodinae DSM 8989 TaxID=1227456 RepID=M0N9P1_9EURY|nr:MULTISPECIES: hypothetical protein [Halococcus]EMA53370.1 hypothetical protein C450_08657 [Halococcus salifodinae DSM 8989]
MNLALVSWLAYLVTGGLLFAQSLVDVLARRRFRYSVAMLIGSTGLLISLSVRALNAGGIPSGEPPMAAAVLAVAGFVAVAIGTTWRFVGQTRS